MKKIVVCVALIGAAACSEPAHEPAPSSAPVAATVPVPSAPVVPATLPTPAKPVVGPKLTAPPAGVPQALFDVAAKHNDEPGGDELTARLRKRAVELRTACDRRSVEAEPLCDNAWYLSCSAGEAQEFWLSGFEGNTAIYSKDDPPREYFRINYVDEGGWKVDAKGCGGAAYFEEPWAKQPKPKVQY